MDAYNACRISSTNFTAIAAEFRARALQRLRRGNALVFHRRHTAREDGFRNERQRDAEIERDLAGPLAGSLLAGGVQDHVHEIIAGLGVFRSENFRCDFDEVRIQLGRVPLGKYVREIRRLKPSAFFRSA